MNTLKDEFESIDFQESWSNLTWDKETYFDHIDQNKDNKICTRLWTHLCLLKKSLFPPFWTESLQKWEADNKFAFLPPEIFS